VRSTTSKAIGAATSRSAIESRELKQGMPGRWREPEDELPGNRIGQSGRRGPVTRAGCFWPNRLLRQSGPAGSFVVAS